jgi:hypothetical protein
MAQKITVMLEDDLDGGPAAETVRFGLGGTEYEIDLNEKNAKAFRKLDRPGDLGGSDPWEDAESCQHSGSTPRSCASAR